MELFLELTTFAFCAVVAAHAWRLRGLRGLSFLFALLVLGFVRENFVVLRDILYGYGDLLTLGAAPILGAVIWGYSLYVAVCWTEVMTGERLDDLLPSPRFLLLVGLFMMALVGFYEPFLDLVDMARWQDGTRKTLGMPWIALIGYPSLTVPFVKLWCRLTRVGSSLLRRTLLSVTVPVLAIAHAWGLAQLKELLSW